MEILLSYKTYIGLFLGAWVACYVLVPIVRRMALRWEAFDPPSDRRVRENIPTLGGLAVAAPFYLGLALLFVWPNFVSSRFFAGDRRVLALIVGGLVMLALGAYDDLRGSGAWVKMPVQVLAAILVCILAGPVGRLYLPLFGEVELGLAAVPITVFWIVAITNAFNLIDGVDGLAAGVGLVVFGVNFFIAQIYGHVEMMVVAALMCGGLLAFLRYNFYPANIFLGDTGSMFVGFMVAVTSLLSSMKAPTTAMLLIPVGLLGYPILDVTLAVVRRVVKGKPVLSSDRSHIHHKLLFCGLGHRTSSAVAYGLTLLFAGIVIFSIYGRHRLVGLLVALAACALLAMFRKFGYWEFLRRTLSPGLRRKYRLYHLMQQVTDLKLRDASSVAEMWELMRNLAEDYNLRTMRLYVGDQDRRWARAGAEEGGEASTREFDLSYDDARLVVSHEAGKDQDMELEQNLLLEKTSERLSREMERVCGTRDVVEKQLRREEQIA